MQSSSSTSSNDPAAISPVAAHGADHHEEHPDHRMLGFTLFLISEGMLFVGLFVAYLTFRAAAPAWPPPGTPELAKLWPTIFTVILVSSSGTIILAEHFLKHGDQNKFRLFWLITFVMGAIFIAGQAFEWNTLINHEHLTLKSGLYGGTFFLLTGFHGMHVIVGLLLQLIVFLRAFKKGRYTPEKHFGVGASSLYWHFVDIVWIFLFGLLYVV
ncbi:cytochrome c oxidase subunit 3 [Gloeobacter kilaueensis]|uniref:Oxidase aa(3) subunit 3 n=1 Tax=Gloeobacter kilaueensis (strain ATCC BAA-2537 / CCAP 1431/1 / ULC 316 / JS1) TaxID=1183438 RepID=U5QR47_GLOK1|nr:heme-copper oxidase subunit III [Gloeobacter kilaueensis]AGY60134.1 cytochrome c oxidase subunit III [Gloeobacter kilaueensis JS1]